MNNICIICSRSREDAHLCSAYHCDFRDAKEEECNEEEEHYAKANYMTIEEFEKELKEHDWFYDYSDDSSVWRRGKDNFQKLVNLAVILTREHRALFNKYYKDHFPNAPFLFKQD